MNELEQAITEFVEKILFFIGVVASVDVIIDTADEETYHVTLSGDDLGLVIGYHGEGISSFQNVLSLMVFKKFGKYYHLVVDVNGYRREREEKIKDMVKNAVDRVKFSERPFELPPMVAFERRLAHLEASKFEGVASESVGDGYSRRVVVKKKDDIGV